MHFDSVYSLGHEIGSGNFSIVRIGTHKQTGEKHAVKIVKRAQLPVEDEESILMEVSLLLLQLCFTFLCLVNWPLPCQGFGYTTTTTYCILNDSKYF